MISSSVINVAATLYAIWPMRPQKYLQDQLPVSASLPPHDDAQRRLFMSLVTALFLLHFHDFTFSPCVTAIYVCIFVEISIFVAIEGWQFFFFLFSSKSPSSWFIYRYKRVGGAWKIILLLLFSFLSFFFLFIYRWGDSFVVRGSFLYTFATFLHSFFL